MYLYFLFYTTMSECMIFYGPTVPEINYSILLFYSKGQRRREDGQCSFCQISREINVIK